jgi:hypothetical protein
LGLPENGVRGSPLSKHFIFFLKLAYRARSGFLGRIFLGLKEIFFPEKKGFSAEPIGPGSPATKK